MQRSIIPVILLPIAVLVAAGVILWALFKPEVKPLAPALVAAQQAAATKQVAVNGNAIARRANALSAAAINTSHKDAVAAQKQAASAAQSAHKDAQTTQQQAVKATAAATDAGAHGEQGDGDGEQGAAGSDAAVHRVAVRRAARTAAQLHAELRNASALHRTGVTGADVLRHGCRPRQPGHRRGDGDTDARRASRCSSSRSRVARAPTSSP